MPVIGTFQAVKDGYIGSIRTLMLNGRVKILANDRKDSEEAPDFRISLGTTEIGAAWRRTRAGHRPDLPARPPRRSGLAATRLGRADRRKSIGRRQAPARLVPGPFSAPPGARRNGTARSTASNAAVPVPVVGGERAPQVPGDPLHRRPSCSRLRPRSRQSTSRTGTSPCRYRRRCRGRQSTGRSRRRPPWYRVRTPGARRLPSGAYP